MRCWHGYLSEARCKWFAYGPDDATATPIISGFIKIQIGLTFLVLSYPGCPGKEAVKQVSVPVIIFLTSWWYLQVWARVKDWCQWIAIDRSQIYQPVSTLPRAGDCLCYTAFWLKRVLLPSKMLTVFFPTYCKSTVFCGLCVTGSHLGLLDSVALGRLWQLPATCCLVPSHPSSGWRTVKCLLSRCLQTAQSVYFTTQ